MLLIKNSQNKIISHYIETAYKAWLAGEEASKIWLRSFLKDYSEIEERHPVSFDEKRGYYGYLAFLWDIHEALVKEDYKAACSEIYKMAFFIDLLQDRVHHNLVQLLSESLAEGERNDQQ